MSPVAVRPNLQVDSAQDTPAPGSLESPKQ